MTDGFAPFIASHHSSVWKTSASWSGCCAFLLTVDDGSVHTANFRFS